MPPPPLQVLAQQGLGKYCDPDFIRYTSLEMQEALEMTTEEMDLAAHQLLLQQGAGNRADNTHLINSSSNHSGGFENARQSTRL